MSETLKNWAGNLTYSAKEVHRPASVEELQTLVAGLDRARPLGSRHSFNRVADTDAHLVSTERLSRVISIAPEAKKATVEGGASYGELAAALRGSGLALHNLASLPHISVAGACATATHGSGVRNGNLATAVSAVEIVRADGELVRLSREADPNTFPGAVVTLGALGFTARLTLDLVPTFDIRQTVYEDLPFETALDEFDPIVSAAYSVSLFTTWREDRFEQVWTKRRDDDEGHGETFFGAHRAAEARHPVPGVNPLWTTAQGGEPGPWDDRLAHFRMEFTPSAGEELQSEWILPRANAPEALRAVAALRGEIAPLVQVSEIRTVAADDLWLSSSYDRDSVCIHFTWLPEGEAVARLLPKLERVFTPFSARPHWGKLSALNPSEMAPRYERLSDFVRLTRIFDPNAKFRNAFVDSLLTETNV